MHLESRGTLAGSRVYHVRRREQRFVYSTPVSLQRFLRFGPFVTRGVCLDISMQGMSALVCGAPRVGETVVIGLPLREAAVEMLATVRHSNDAKSGFEFYPLSPVARDGIQNWLEELGKNEEMLFPSPFSHVPKFGCD